MADDPAARAAAILGHSRWWQVIAAMLMMALVSPYQYVWSSIEGPLSAHLDASLAALGTVFTAYVVIMTVTQFPAGWYRDRFGPRKLTALAGILAGVGYVGSGLATAFWQLLLAYAIGSVGVGIVYTIAVNTALKWFPDRPGLTAGLGTMAFGAGAVVFIPIVRAFDAPDTLPMVLVAMGVAIFVGVTVGSLVLRDPPRHWRVERAPDGGRAPDRVKQYHWREVLRTWQFWLLYFMFVAVSAAGLMITARIVLFSEYLGLAAVVATAAAVVVPIASGGGRLVVGWVSDRMRRERAMAYSFLACGLATIGLVGLGAAGRSVVYLVAVVVAVFFWSAQFSLFPALTAEYYGTAMSSTNYALVYSAKLWGGVFGGTIVGVLVVLLGWEATFAVGGLLAVFAGVGAFLLRPPRATDTSFDP